MSITHVQVVGAKKDGLGLFKRVLTELGFSTLESDENQGFRYASQGQLVLITVLGEQSVRLVISGDMRLLLQALGAYCFAREFQPITSPNTDDFCIYRSTDIRSLPAVKQSNLRGCYRGKYSSQDKAYLFATFDLKSLTLPLAILIGCSNAVEDQLGNPVFRGQFHPLTQS